MGRWERSQPGAALLSRDCNRSGLPWRRRLLLGVLITGWHLPLVFMPQFDLGLPDIASTVVVTFWYAWLFNRTGGSVLLPLIAHVTEGCVNTQGLWPAGAERRPRGLDLVDRLGSARRSPVDLRSQVLAYGARVGN